MELLGYYTLYGRKYRSPLYWSKVAEKSLLGPHLVQQTIELELLNYQYLCLKLYALTYGHYDDF